MMKTETEINKKFLYLKDFIGRLPESYNDSGESIYIGRNDVKVIHVNGLTLAVKYYKKLTLANRYIYATIRKSKAQRAFEHTQLLLEKGINSPEHVGYVNCYKYGMLNKSYYVSLYTDYMPLKNLFDLPASESEEALKAFARYTFKLHQSGVFHKDYTVNNVLYSFKEDGYDFSLIDNNRMKFGRYSFRKGMQNLKRLMIPVQSMGVVAAEYARVAGVSDFDTLNAMVLIRWSHHIVRTLRRWLKAPIRLVTGHKLGTPINIKLKERPVDLLNQS